MFRHYFGLGAAVSRALTMMIPIFPPYMPGSNFVDAIMDGERLVPQQTGPGKRSCASRYWQARSCYMPHQGPREKARRRRQMAAKNYDDAIMQLSDLLH